VENRLNNPKRKHVPKLSNDQRENIDKYAAAAIRLLILTGARVGEILHLEWDHVDLERGLLFLSDSKTGRKTIVLNSAAMEILSSLQAEKIKGRFVIVGAAPDKPRVDLKRPWAAVRRQAKLQEIRLHDLRHTFASVGAGASLGLPIVGKLLGHTQPQTTARYAHLDADPLRRASNLIGSYIQAAMTRSI